MNKYVKFRPLACLLTVAALLFLMTLTVCADVIVDPERNSFFISHIAECVELRRCFTVNDPSGSLDAYDEPGAKKPSETYPNGTVLEISHTYTDADGTVWGVTIYAEDSFNGNWMKMSGLELVYDYISFAEEHGDAFADYDAAKHPAPKGPANLWKYPDSGIVVGTVGEYDELESHISKVYTAPDGRVWGFINYIFGHKNVWICLEGAEPEAKETDNAKVLGVAADSISQGNETGKPITWLIPVAAVVVLAGTAGVLIAVFMKKKKQTGK